MKKVKWYNASLLLNSKVYFNEDPYVPYKVARDLFIRAEQAEAKLERKENAEKSKG